MCTDRQIFWQCLHKHSTETPSTRCEFHLINLRYPVISALDPGVSYAYRERHLANQAKCAALHSVVDLVFEDHVCDTCELRAAVAREESKAVERQAEREAGLLRLAERVESFERWVFEEEERAFEEFSSEESLGDGSSEGQEEDECSEGQEEVREAFEGDLDEE